MNKHHFIQKAVFLLSLFVGTLVHAQIGSVKGHILDGESMQNVQGVRISLVGTNIQQTTDNKGLFFFENIEKGSYTLKITHTNYQSQQIKIFVTDKKLDLEDVFLFKSLKDEQESAIITLTDEELLNDEGGADNITGLLTSSRDVFLKTAAFNFGQSWFRVRGLETKNAAVLINNVPMNKWYSGRPQWSNWGGLNDATRNQEFTNGISPNEHTFGGVLGTTSISTKASEYRAGTKATLSLANRNYTGRLMFTHASGLKNKWAYMVSASKRLAQEGYFQGTFYDANSLFASVEYLPNSNHSINFTGIYAYNRRGKSSANTQEVIDLKGTTYNSYWGYQDNKSRNAREKEIAEPILMLSHSWNITPATTLNSTVSYQFGNVGNSRLGYFNAPNPDPTYYRYLPSYYERDFPFSPELSNRVAERFQLDDSYGQINWEKLYKINKEYGKSRYYLYEDRNDDRQFSAVSVLNTDINQYIQLIFGGMYQTLISNNYAKMLDLLGGSHFEDIDQYSNTKNNLKRTTTTNKGDTFLYNYQLTGTVANAFAQAKFNYKKWDFYTALQWETTSYQREGLFQNELYKNSSFGKGKKVSFKNLLSGKAGAMYKITGRHLVGINVAYVNKAPVLKDVYTNSRMNQDVTLNIDSERTIAFDASYFLRLPKVTGRLTGYFARLENNTNIARYFNQNLGDFISEVTTEISKKHIGVELGVDYQINSTLKTSLVVALGQNTYDNNPSTYYTSDSFPLEKATPEISYIYENHLSGTPEKAISIGFEYRNPNYWWLGANVNYLSDAYVNISPGLRTKKFTINPKTNRPFEGIRQKDIDKLWKQEKFAPYTLVNLVGGKSWKIGHRYISLFATVNNIFNVKYKTNGYEQARNGNYQLLMQDQARKKPLFGSKYWYGYGRTFFVNFSVSF